MAFDREKTLVTVSKLIEKKHYAKALLEYQKIVDDDPADVRTMLKMADLRVQMEAYVDAITMYDRVAKLYAEQGFELKARAVYTQLRELVQKHAPHLAEGYAEPKKRAPAEAASKLTFDSTKKLT